MLYKNYIKIKYYNNIFNKLQQIFIGNLIKKGKKLVALKN
jgi:hypothetical protein